MMMMTLETGRLHNPCVVVKVAECNKAKGGTCPLGTLLPSCCSNRLQKIKGAASSDYFCWIAPPSSTRPFSTACHKSQRDSLHSRRTLSKHSHALSFGRDLQRCMREDVGIFNFFLRRLSLSSSEVFNVTNSPLTLQVFL